MVDLCDRSIYDIVVLFEPLLFLSYCILPGVILDAGNAGSRSLERRLAKNDLKDPWRIWACGEFSLLKRNIVLLF